MFTWIIAVMAFLRSNGQAIMFHNCDLFTYYYGRSM